MDTLENPVIKPESSDEAELLALSQNADNERAIGDTDSAETSSDTRAEQLDSNVSQEIKPDNSETDPETQQSDRPRDALGRFTKTESGDEIPEAERTPVEATKPESPYTRAQKEAQRREVTWQKINERKEELEQRERALAQRQQQMAQGPAQQQQQRRMPYSSQELAGAADEFESKAIKALNEGDYDVHGENLQLARQAREHAQQAYRIEVQEHQQQQQQQHWNHWNEVMNRVMATDESVRTQNSPVAKRIAELLVTTEPEFMTPYGVNVFSAQPNGFAMAARYAKKELEAGSASELRANNKKIQAENDRLNGLTGIRGSGPTSPRQARDFDSLPLDEQLRQLEQATAEADGH